MKLPRTRRFPSFLEPLEDRIALANDVQTSFNNGTLTITTVDQLGEAEILANENDQIFTIIGNGVGEVTVNQTGATTIDGGSSAAFNGVTRLIAEVRSVGGRRQRLNGLKKGRPRLLEDGLRCFAGISCQWAG